MSKKQFSFGLREAVFLALAAIAIASFVAIRSL